MSRFYIIVNNFDAFQQKGKVAYVTFNMLYAVLWMVLNVISIPRSPWRSPLSALLLCSMTHYDITMGNGVGRNIHCDVKKSNDVSMEVYTMTS